MSLNGNSYIKKVIDLFYNKFNFVYRDCACWKIWWLICAMSYYRVFGAKRRKGATRKPVKWWLFRVFATYRPATRKYDTFHGSPFPLLFVVYLPGGAKGRHAKTRQNHHLACFRVATFRLAKQRYDKQGRKRERLPRENPPNGDFFVFSHGDLSPRHTKLRDIPCVAFSATVCCIFAFWRVFAWRPFAFSPRKHVYTTWHKSATIGKRFYFKHIATYYIRLNRTK